MCIHSNRRDEELDRAWRVIYKNGHWILIGNMNAKLSWECECNGLYVESNDRALKLVNFTYGNNVQWY
jgi:hypothetical protein